MAKINQNIDVHQKTRAKPFIKYIKSKCFRGQLNLSGKKKTKMKLFKMVHGGGSCRNSEGY